MINVLQPIVIGVETGPDVGLGVGEAFAVSLGEALGVSLGDDEGVGAQPLSAASASSETANGTTAVRSAGILHCHPPVRDFGTDTPPGCSTARLGKIAACESRRIDRHAARHRSRDGGRARGRGRGG